MQTAASKPRWSVVTESGLPVYEGSRAQCNSYLRQAIKKGSPPGFLRIVKTDDLEKEAR